MTGYEHVNLGKTLFHKDHKPDEAIKQFQLAIASKDCEIYGCYMYIAHILAATRRKGESIQYYRLAAQSAPGNPEPYLFLAKVYSDLGMREDCLTSVDALEDTTYPKAEMYELRGQYLSLFGQQKEATRYFLRANALRPKGAMTLRGKACLLSAQKRYDQALPLLCDYLRDHPDDVDVYKVRAYVYYNIGDIKLAIKDALRFTQSAPNDVLMINELVEWSSRANDDQSLKKAKEALITASKNVTDTAILEEIGTCLCMHGFYFDGAEVLQRCLSSESKGRFNAMYFLSHCYFNIGNWQKCDDCAKSALLLSSSETRRVSELKLLRCEAQERAGNPQNALAELNEILSESPNFLEGTALRALNLKAHVLRNLNKMDEAAKTETEAERLSAMKYGAILRRLNLSSP